MAYRAYDRGMPIVRPLFFANPDADRLTDVDDAYLFGDSFLVAPVVEEGKRSKQVPLPSGPWVNYWTDEVVEGGQTVTVEAPLDRLPLFVKKGSIVPMRPTAPDYVGHSVADTLELAVYPSEDDGQFTLYEDDGHTRAYEQGASATTTFAQQRTRTDSTTTLDVTLGAARGRFSGQPDQRTYHVVAHQMTRPVRTVTLDGRALPEQRSPSALRSDAITVRRTVESVQLQPPAPNPVRRRAAVRVTLPIGQEATLRLYDVLGRKVKTRGLDENTGRQQVPLDVSGLSSGVYFLRLRTDGAVKTQRLTVVR
jgi:hypothetical protein